MKITQCNVENDGLELQSQFNVVLNQSILYYVKASAFIPLACKYMYAWQVHPSNVSETVSTQHTVLVLKIASLVLKATREVGSIALTDKAVMSLNAHRSGHNQFDP